MSIAPQDDALTRSKWRQILELGELLMCHQPSVSSETLQVSLTSLRAKIIEAVETLLGGIASLWLVESTLRSFTGKLPGVVRLAAETAPSSLPSSLMRLAMDNNQLHRGESSDGAAWTLTPDTSSRSVKAIAAPLLTLDRQRTATKTLGALQVVRSDNSAFDEEEIEMLEAIADQAAMALKAILLNANENWRLEQLSLVQKVSTQISDMHDLDGLAQRITSLIQQTFDYYYVAIFTLDTGHDILHFRASAGPASGDKALIEEPYSPALVVHLGQGIIGYVAETGQEVLANDVRREARYKHLDVLPETLSEAALPLSIEDRLLGVLDVQSEQLDYFDETDMLVLNALAANIALAVEGARLYNALQKRADQLSTVYEVSAAIASILEQEELLDEVVNLIQKRFGFPYVHLFSVHPGRRTIIYEAGSGSRSQQLSEQGFAYNLDDPQGIIPWVARHAETVLTNDVNLEPRYRPSVLPPDETLSELTVPLTFGNSVLGILDIQSDLLGAFTEDDRFLFEALADNIAISMRNATLYRSEVWRRQVTDSLREVAGLLSADVDLDQVLEVILNEIERTLPVDLTAIWLLDDEPVDEESKSTASLHLAASHSVSTANIQLEIGWSPEDVSEFNLPASKEFSPSDVSTLLLDALNSDEPLIRTVKSPYEPLGAALCFPPDYSAIAAPLRVGEQNLGVLTMAHHASGRYGNEALAMTAAFASYAAVAIENTRLYEEAHEQAWVSTVLLQVADATQSLTNLNELLATVIHITPMLVGVKACLLYILDEDGIFVPAVASGLQPDQQVEFERRHFGPGDVLELDQLYDEKHPLLITRTEDNQALTTILDNHAQENQPINELLVLVPLLARGEVLGAFLVDYTTGFLEGNDSRAIEEFFDERLAIIQGVAHQTAIAVENIRLLKSQKEEAYVSVALLQVAQAVVSSIDLDEALGSIVRITPILVGVKRASIFLWDATQSVFRMSQSYGIPRSEQNEIYLPMEFPLLDAVRQENRLFAYPLSDDLSNTDDVPNTWSFLIPPDPEEVDEFLVNECCLLLAVPLAVKDEVLGVFFVEEPESPSTESFSTSNTNRRLRSKRLEIITGISQQVAMAIQNDLLQKETLERERLGREMQLAREIQRTFLPQKLPDLPGWDLKVHWLTAREMGGDYYDFFELPNNRLGLVIADVADKGMPAALFMTLVRTLVRATIQVIDAPDAVLERVNDILVPDAPKGMFVTIVYAVLSLDTGEIELAVAGHNPPLLLRSRTCALERIERSGMALGVQEHNQLDGRKSILHLGDYLIMYTDGVTEAFSPNGDIFGEERLQQTINQTAVCIFSQGDPTIPDAQAMIDAINASVTAFTGGSMPSDDLTLVVLKRTNQQN